MSRDFLIPSQSHTIEYEIKKSRFIGKAFFAESREQAMAILADVRSEFPDARHHCWAYLIGNPNSPETVAMSDDGEPSGTAGKPILNVLQHKNIGNVMLIVVRYFGGIKLGAGGLVRAYSTAAEQVMSSLHTEKRIALEEFIVEGSFALEQSLRHWLSSRSGTVMDVEYAQLVTFKVALPELYKNELVAFIEAEGAHLQDN